MSISDSAPLARECRDDGGVRHHDGAPRWRRLSLGIAASLAAHAIAGIALLAIAGRVASLPAGNGALIYLTYEPGGGGEEGASRGEGVRTAPASHSPAKSTQTERQQPELKRTRRKRARLDVQRARRRHALAAPVPIEPSPAPRAAERTASTGVIGPAIGRAANGSASGNSNGAGEGNSVGGGTGNGAGLDGGGSVGGLFSLDQVPYPPVIVSRVMPKYPMRARARGLGGEVVLRAIVGRDGTVENNVVVAQSSPMFDQSAVEALRQWRFEPARDRLGRPVRVLLEVPIRFELR